MLKLQFAGLNGLSSVGFQSLNVGLSRFVAFGLLLLIFYYSSILFWRAAYPHAFKSAVVVEKTVEFKSPRKGKWLWFADTDVKIKSEATKASPLKATLIGVISPGEEGKGIALISVKKKRAKLFRVGDEVDTAIFLQSVGSDFVNLERDGKLEVLRIKKSNLFTNEQGVQGMGSGKNQQSTGLLNVQSHQDLVYQFRKDISKKPSKILDYVDFRMVKKKGTEGVKIKPKGQDKQDLFDALGLQEGDVIVSVNDKKVNELRRNIKDLQDMLKEGALSLTIIRDGALIEILVE